MVIFMPWTPIKSLQLAPEWELNCMLHLEGWYVKTPLWHVSQPFRRKGVKVFGPRTSPSRWSSPKSITRPSVPVQTEVQSSLSSGSDVGRLPVMGGLATRLEGPDQRAPTHRLVFLRHALRPRFSSQLHHGFLIRACLETRVNSTWAQISSGLEEETLFQPRLCPSPAPSVQLRLDTEEKHLLMDPLLPSSLPY